MSNIAWSNLRNACVGAVTQQFACTRLVHFAFRPQRVQSSVVRATYYKMANRTKASEQLDEFSKSKKVCEFYSWQSKVWNQDFFFSVQSILSCYSFVDHCFFSVRARLSSLSYTNFTGPQYEWSVSSHSAEYFELRSRKRTFLVHNAKLLLVWWRM